MLNQETTTRRVLIIGGGIAGPALALFLKRAGIESEIYEAREMVEGYSLSLSCNGVAVLKLLGLDLDVLSKGSPVTKWAMFNSREKRLGGGLLAVGGNKSVFLKRAPLVLALTEEVERQGIAIHRGKKLQGIETNTDFGVKAIFQDGTSVEGSLLVGADGVHSKVRHYVDPMVRPTYTGLINTGGYTQNVKLPFEPETIKFIFGKRAFFGYHVSLSGYIYWFANYFQPTQPDRDALQAPDRVKLKLLDLFCDDQPMINEIIQNAETVFPEFLTYTLPTQPKTWHSQHIVLMGDAAHAISSSSGQGASMALEDAAILAKCLRDIPDAEQALTMYEYLRRERTAKMYEVAERGDSGKFATRPFQQWMRDLMTPIFLSLFANPKASEWMYTFKIAWDERVKMDTALEKPSAHP